MDSYQIKLLCTDRVIYLSEATQEDIEAVSSLLNFDWLNFWSRRDPDCEAIVKLMRMVMLSHFHKNKQSISVTESSNNTESPIQSEGLDDRAYTESFDDVIATCPRTYMTLQERYKFNKNNKPSLTRKNAV